MKSQFKVLIALVATLVVAACANQMEPAQKALAEVEAAVQAASADAQKYLPEQYASVDQKLSELKASFDKKEYAAVVTGAPALLTDVKSLASAAAAKKKEVMDALGAQWTSLSASLPQAVAAIESRLTALAKTKKLPQGVTKDAVTAATSGLTEVKAAWNDATAAFGAGKVDEAVTKAKAVKDKVDEISKSLAISG
jgi:hypothetical protein